MDGGPAACDIASTILLQQRGKTILSFFLKHKATERRDKPISTLW